jgi:hypothetical protein
MRAIRANDFNTEMQLDVRKHRNLCYENMESIARMREFYVKLTNERTARESAWCVCVGDILTESYIMIAMR